MATPWLLNAAIVIVTVIFMEIAATLVHRYVMHGLGWGWHRSHHQSSPGLLERNDLYALLFGALSVIPFVLGDRWPLLWWVGVGLLVYGLLYGLLHDVIVHRRIPFLKSPRSGYLKRLVQAHRLHHATKEKDGAVSFGFLHAPPVPRLLEELRAQRRRA